MLGRLRSAGTVHDTGPVTSAATGAPGRVRRHVVGAAVGMGAAAILATTLVLTHHPSSGTSQRPTGIPDALPTAVADTMGIAPVPTVPAPHFALTDQDGRTVDLTRLRGKVVVLEAMDPHCTDICPIVSAEFLDAYRRLGTKRDQVVFVALNVNRYHAGVDDMLAFSQHNGLTALPTWHFVTGSVPALQAAWKGYGIEVQAPDPNADILHTSVVWFIDPAGVERYVATPMVEHSAGGASFLPPAVQATWAQGIAVVAGSMIG